MKQLVSFLIPALLLMACGSRERISKDVFDQVNKSMEAKKLSDAQIIQEAMIWGDSISTEAQQLLMQNLHTKVNENGYAEALEFCNINAVPIIEELANTYGISIRRTSTRARNQANLPTADEVPLLEAYQYNVENNIKNESNIQAIAEGDVLLYTKAIVISSEFCLACHGVPTKDLEVDVLSKIDSLYPEDSARDFGLGDLRGIWSLEIPKKAVVNRL
ncbi:Tll0287-like domain-containing protein [Algoriphagus chordae]|uniref:Uncharacterized protein DUF3365 n=1 Tax=Algoriphagus chordae TaxID=237019 RepID=A0A2W7RTH6_9BACT|nr:DUF3365 domain-containing protein [Algoriphagus chordae]PZX57869.1 uncharacterized protein DUF3365 [Algoriphagus chordae]